MAICSTCENQDRADFRLPYLINAPIKHRFITSEPMLEEIHIEKYLETGLIEKVVCGGESGSKARPCDFEWIKEMRKQCVEYNVEFFFKQTGAVFIKDGKTYHIERKFQSSQARKAKMNYQP